MNKSTLKMFVCGPTVYDLIHVGNARTFVVFDAFAKWLRHTGVDLRYIQNITDIDDKIIARAKEHAKDPFSYSRELENEFRKDVQALGITSPEYHRATDHIPEIKSQVERLLKTGHAYEIKGNGIYFDLSTFPDYGKLSGRTKLQDDDAVSRIDENPNKRNSGDFCVWKGSWENGRPGWHIEDTAITEKYLGPQYDIHGGGMDLQFPHHEAEVAIMESISGLKPFVKKWMWVGFLVNKNRKMSKSLGNFMTARQALKQYSAEGLRYYFLSAHYRSPLDFSEDNLKQAEAATQRLAEFLRKLERFEDEMPREPNAPISAMIQKTREDFTHALDDDFNTPRTFGVLFELIKELNPLIGNRTLDQENAQEIKRLFEIVRNVFGIVSRHGFELPKTIEMLIEQRERARQSKDFELADKLRGQIEEGGYRVDDTAYGPLVKKK